MNEKQKPVVTVVTVVYNDSSHIENTIQSVLGQTYKNIEYIIIDGASSDGTVEIIDKYREQLTFFITEKDKGVYDAMNKSIPHIHGEWVIFMNSGDSFYDKDVLSSIFDEYDDHDELIICGDTMKVDGAEKKLAKATWEGKQKYMPSQHQSILIRARAYQSHPYDTRYRIIADYALFYDLLKPDFSRYYYYKGVIANYDATGLSSRRRMELNKEHMKLFARHLDPRFFWQATLYIKHKLFGYRQTPKYLEK